MVQTSTLKKIAIYGGFAALAGAAFITEKIHANFISAHYYQESMRLLRRYKGAVETLGEPITSKRLDLGSGDNVIDGLNAKLAIPVKGPKNTGVLHVRASRPSGKHNWEVQTLELELQSGTDRQRTLFYDVTSPSTSLSTSSSTTHNSGLS